LEIMPRAARPRQDANLGQAAGAFLQDQMIAEQFEVAEINVVAVRDDLPPVFPRRPIQRRPQEARIPGLMIGADNEAVFEMIEVILVVALARQEYLKFAERPIGVQVAVFLAVG